MLYHPLTPDRWPDFEALMGKRGAYGGCWCMWWRITRGQFEKNQGAGNRRAMKKLVDSGTVPGILCYVDGEPTAWCSVAPREDFASLNRSHVLKPIDDEPVWSLVCFHVGKAHRRQGLIKDVIAAAIDYVRSRGGRIVEAYPSVPRSGNVPPTSSFMGFPAVFEQAGFVEVAAPSEAKRVMRFTID